MFAIFCDKIMSLFYRQNKLRLAYPFYESLVFTLLNWYGFHYKDEIKFLYNRASCIHLPLMECSEGGGYFSDHNGGLIVPYNSGGSMTEMRRNNIL